MTFILSELSIFELMEVGFFDAFWNWGNVYLTAAVYLCVLIGCGIQYLLLKKCQTSSLRWMLVGLCAFGVLFLEYTLYFINGWESLGLLLLYGGVLCVLLGAVLMTILYKIKNWRKQVSTP